MKYKKLNIGFLRQWLNEERIQDSKKMVTNAEIEFMLGIIDEDEFDKRQEKEKAIQKHISNKLKNALKINK